MIISMIVLQGLLNLVSVTATALGAHSYGSKISKRGLYIREQTTSSDFAPKGPVIDLGYARYEGYYDSSFDIFTFRGQVDSSDRKLRYASKPNRWQLPKRPNRGPGSEKVLKATANPPRCPQSPFSPIIEDYSFERDALGDEDCLFLNLFTPANKTQLPVLFWIHGGGYGQDWAANYDFSNMAKTVGNGFVTVIIQYRLGAFGFASSAEIGHFGIPNAGVHDMRFALEWVRDYIHLFGGDPTRVTIAGESAGGGGVMLMTMANNGSEGTSLFQRAIVSSPYLPTQWRYDDMQPSQAYYDLAARAGCLGPGTTQNRSVFGCLQSVDSAVLQNASAFVSMGARWGQWAFLPVTDDRLIIQRPTKQLLQARVNGVAILSGNNANEGTLFVPTDVRTEDDFLARTRLDYPLLSEENMTAIMSFYKIEEHAPSGPLYSTDGVNPPFATSLSGVASGWLQAAYNLYAEATFVCPAMFLADAFSSGGDSSTNVTKRAWRYQYSPPPAFHDDDLDVLMKPVLDKNDNDGAKESVGFRIAFQSMWGRFIINGDPTLDENTVASAKQMGDDVSAAKKSTWLPWGLRSSSLNHSTHSMLNLNMTRPEGGVADFQTVDGFTWEGGRGDRCKLWADLGPWAPA
ncbi:carboxylesterase [Colletotrichum navitas]|uniref:Carboxylic ester hydrolase n=1 Tax=Colletotrichum navitas TaxID=681940 RepID=A0AAD8UY96_9PEZI|nr:carboxylesterase [Colletotrichum navitas]KAK1564192.1 carboxylesterase [Colletotrichum navitas]